MNEDEKQKEINEMTELLIRLRPARGELDSRVVFYEAGFSAGQAAVASPRRPKLSLLIAAGLLAAVVTAPASYRIGRTAAVGQSLEPVPAVAGDSLAQQRPIVDEAPRDAVSPEAALPEVIEPPSRPDLFARWMQPFSQVALAAKFDIGSETTLTAFHGTSVSLDDTDRDWLDFPFASTLAKNRDFSAASSGNRWEPVSTLTASDLQAMAQNLETAR